MADRVWRKSRKEKEKIRKKERTNEKVCLSLRRVVGGQRHPRGLGGRGDGEEENGPW